MRAPRYKSKGWSDVQLEIHWLLNDISNELNLGRIHYGLVPKKICALAFPPLNGINVVYILVKGSNFVYVGQSKKVHNRIYNHIVTKKDFSKVYYFLADNKKMALHMELAAIKRLKPDLNIYGNEQKK